MKKNSLIGRESDYYHDKEDYLQLEKCPNGGIKCLSQRAVINESMRISRIQIDNKNYNDVIIHLKKAFESTYDLDFNPCMNCAVFFRNLIYNSLKKTESDLINLTSGLFRKKRYLYNLEQVRNILDEMKSKIEKEDSSG